MHITVVIPLYNKERHIGRAVKSVLNQTYQNFEIIVVDDGSTDDSVKKLQNIKDSRIKIIKKTNEGVSSARNKGIDKSKIGIIYKIDDININNFNSPALDNYR